MRKETYMSTQKKKEKKKKNKKETKNVEKKIHTHQIKLKKAKRSKRPVLLGVYLSKSKKESSLFSLHNLSKLKILSFGRLDEKIPRSH